VVRDMTDIDLKAHEYHAAATSSPHKRWFWWSIVAAIVAFFVSAWSGPTYWTVLLVGVALFTAGKSYSRWVHEPVFQAGGMLSVILYFAFLALGLVLNVVIGEPIYWFIGTLFH